MSRVVLYGVVGRLVFPGVWDGGPRQLAQGDPSFARVAARPRCVGVGAYDMDMYGGYDDGPPAREGPAGCYLGAPTHTCDCKVSKEECSGLSRRALALTFDISVFTDVYP